MAKRKKNRKKNPRVKKTKYLSLTSLRFPPDPIHHHIPLPTTPTVTDDHFLSDNMDYLLSSASDHGDATTLTALLLDSSSSPPLLVPDSDQLSPSPASVSYVSEAIKLVRTALRSREIWDHSTSTPNHHHHVQERYVRYSQVVDDRRDHEEVSSTADNCKRRRRLALKLDYEEIIKAWSDKGGFYLSPSPLQTVPDVIHHPHSPSFTYEGGLWSVPEGNIGAMKEEEMEEEEEVARVPQDDKLEQQHRVPGQREASVLRYKEKRRNRLFSKTIRYQVRKENAQKRPRVKGRFVKRS